jgi:hypothetical protein
MRVKRAALLRRLLSCLRSCRRMWELLYNQEESGTARRGSYPRERTASDLYTVLANISAKRRVVLRILVCWGG